MSISFFPGQPRQLNDYISDMSPQKDIFNNAVDLFTAEQEEVRIAAAFAAGIVNSFIHFVLLKPVVLREYCHRQPSAIPAHPYSDARERSKEALAFVTCPKRGWLKILVGDLEVLIVFS